MLVYVLQGIVLAFGAAVQPGPYQAYLMSRTMAYGWRHAWPAAIAPLLSDGPIIALVLLVLSHVPVWLQRVLYIAGGLFVLYLAWRAFASWRSSESVGIGEAPSPRQGVLRAALVNVLNPSPYIYWSLVTGPILIAGWRASPSYAAAFLIAFYVTFIVCLTGIVVIFGTARRLGAAASRTLLGVSVLALAGFGVYQIYRGFVG